jgi:hypothetical protein
MSLKTDTIANVTSTTGIVAFLADFQVVITTLVLVTAFVLNIKSLVDKFKKKELKNNPPFSGTFIFDSVN